MESYWEAVERARKVGACRKALIEIGRLGIGDEFWRHPKALAAR